MPVTTCPLQLAGTEQRTSRAAHVPAVRHREGPALTAYFSLALGWKQGPTTSTLVGILDMSSQAMIANEKLHTPRVSSTVV